MLIPMALHTAPKQYFNKKSNLHTRCTELPAGGGKIDHILLGGVEAEKNATMQTIGSTTAAKC